MRHLSLYFVVILLFACRYSNSKRFSAISKLPDFEIVSMLDTLGHVWPDKLPAACPIIFMYFDPECDHCQEETKQIVKHAADLAGTKIFMIAHTSYSSLVKFYQEFGLRKMQNLVVGNDTDMSFYRCFVPSAVPFIAIYNKKKELVKIYLGQTDIASIIRSTRDL